MRKTREIFRLKFTCGLSNRKIAASSGVSRITVADYLFRAKVHGLDWPAIESLSEGDLEAKLFAKKAQPSDTKERGWPDFKRVHQELRHNKHVTLYLLWQEYKQEHPDGYSSVWFYEHYKAWRSKLDLVMRQDHKAGEKVFVDYCDGLYLVNPETGDPVMTQLFVAVWGASNYTYAEASLTQELPNWIMSHVRAFEFFDCVPTIEVPDNLKSGVNKACRYEPDLNPTYQALADHYGFAVIPARPYHPRDKAKAEVGVQVAQRWILAALRHRRFSSVADMNAAIWELLEKLNTRPLKKLKKSRQELFLELDKPQALPLPAHRYEYATWKKARVNLDYHIEVDAHYYSVPCRLVHESVDVRTTATTVEVLFQGNRVASHARSGAKYKHTTLSEHMPVAHQKYASITPSRMMAWAKKIGPDTALLVSAILANRKHPEQGYRSALGLIRLERHYGADRLENASKRALQYKSYS